MKVLALEKGLASGAINADLLKAEARRVWELCQEGVVIEAYFRADRHEAVLVLEVQDSQAAKTALDILPLVTEGLITFDLIPLVPYDGFARLFS